MTRKRGRGRPSGYSAAIADRICEELSTTDHALEQICGRPGMPTPSTVYRWLQAYADFRERYARARELQADVLAGQILAISDDTSRDRIVSADGTVVVDHEHINRSRLRVDARKWLAAKLAPKKYGDRVDVGVSDGAGGPVQHTIEVVMVAAAPAVAQPARALLEAGDEEDGGPAA